MIRARLLWFPLLVVCTLTACGRRGAGGGAAESLRGDSLFLAEAPAMVPEELEPELDAMGVKRIYVAGATLAAGGAVKVINPPPPNPIRRPVVFTLMAEPGAEGLLAPGGNGDLVGEAWGSALGKLVADARSWANVVGVHVHILPRPESAEVLAAAMKSLKSALGGKLPVSVTLPPDAPAATWKPLAGAADEALLFAFGRRPDTRDEFVKELNPDDVRDFPLPFRVLVVVGGYGRGGADGSGRRMADGDIDRLSEDRNLDFQFSGVLSTEPGTSVSFQPQPGVPASSTLLAADGGRAVFKYLTSIDLSQFLGDAARWAAPRMKGRVFLLDGVPRDGHLLGFPALRQLLTGKAWEPKLALQVIPQPSSAGGVEFTLQVTNEGQSPTDLSRTHSYVEIRAQGGVFTSVKTGDFDRFEILVPEGDELVPSLYGRATVCRLFENIFVSDEKNSAGPIRVSGAQPKILVGYKLLLPGGREMAQAPEPVTVAVPTPTPAPRRKRK